MSVKTYFKGTSGIENPVDVDGKPIKVGDVLTFSWFDAVVVEHSKSPEDWDRYIHEPVFLVKAHKNGGLFAESLNPKHYLYLHDFKFKHCKNLTA